MVDEAEELRQMREHAERLRYSVLAVRMTNLLLLIYYRTANKSAASSRLAGAVRSEGRA
jgi:hypothetical protein